MTENYTTTMENNFPILYFDGGSRGNPGEAAGAAVIVMPDGQKYTVSQYMQIATNNEAEYTGLIIGLRQAIDLNIQELTVKGDSQLVINQIKGQWKVNSPHLKQFNDEAKQLIKSFQKITLNWIKRNENHLADAAVNHCIDRGENSQTALKKDLNSSPIDRLIKLGKKANLKDYTQLKSGRDEFTSLGLSELKKRVPENIQQEIEKAWNGTDKYLAKVYRWYLRGLPFEMAIEKIKIDADVEAKVTGKHPWLEDENKSSQTEVIFPYTKGDVIVISHPNNSSLNYQGIIVSEPKFSQEGNWNITVKLEDN